MKAKIKGDSIMKRHLSLTAAILIVCAVFALNAEAQTSAPQKVSANIPFAFNVGDKTLPAGVYTLSVVNPSSDRKILQIRSADGRASAIVQTTQISGSLADDAKLVFRRYGDRYFFAQVELAGDATKLVAARSRAERSTERSTRRPIKRSAETTTIAAF